MRKPAFIFLFLGILLNANCQVDHVEPPFWWAGMKHADLQLMLHGNSISGSTVTVEYEGLRLVSVSSVENPNYLFIDLDLDKNIAPGTFKITLIGSDGSEETIDYELKNRVPGSALRKGFDNSDVMYLLMPDRFANGNVTNDVVNGMRESILDRTDKTGRHGGDLQGIIDHLNYVEEMGFTAIWLNPFLENDMDRTSYHGYSTTDFYKVDPRYGTNEDILELSKKAAESGIKIIMDMIFNHIGSRHWWMEDLPSSDWINFYPNYTVTNHRRTVNQDPYASEYDKKLMVDGWFVPTMPDLNQGNKFLAKYLIQNSIWWIEYAGLAGIRMDTYPYPEKEMMSEWCKRVLNEYPDFNIVGEEWSHNPGLISYWQSGKENKDGYEGNLPSLMDFPLQNALTKSLLAEEGWDSGWLTLYETIASDYEYPDPYNLVIFPDNHDMSRFYMQLGMNEALYKLGLTYILTTRGIPQIFYGSEILMTHTESDHHGDIRKDFPGGWDGDKVNAFSGKNLTEEERDMQNFFRVLLNWRKINPVIQTGKMIHFAPEKGVYIYGRYNEDKTVMILLNKSPQNAIIETHSYNELINRFTRGVDILSGKTYDLSSKINIPALTGLVLELK